MKKPKPVFMCFGAAGEISIRTLEKIDKVNLDVEFVKIPGAPRIKGEDGELDQYVKAPKGTKITKLQLRDEKADCYSFWNLDEVVPLDFPARKIMAELFYNRELKRFKFHRRKTIAICKHLNFDQPVFNEEDIKERRENLIFRTENAPKEVFMCFDCHGFAYSTTYVKKHQENIKQTRIFDAPFGPNKDFVTLTNNQFVKVPKGTKILKLKLKNKSSDGKEQHIDYVQEEVVPLTPEAARIMARVIWLQNKEEFKTHRQEYLRGIFAPLADIREQLNNIELYINYNHNNDINF